MKWIMKAVALGTVLLGLASGDVRAITRVGNDAKFGKGSVESGSPLSSGHGGSATACDSEAKKTERKVASVKPASTHRGSGIMPFDKAASNKRRR